MFVLFLRLWLGPDLCVLNCCSLKCMVKTSTIQPMSAALLTHVMCNSCAFSWDTKAFSDQSPSCYQTECFATACCFEAHLTCFILLLLFFYSSFLDISDYFLRGSGCCFLAMQTLASMAALPDIKQERCQCTLFWLSLGFIHSVSLSAFQSVSLCFCWDVSCVQLSCVQYTTPPLLPSPPSHWLF